MDRPNWLSPIRITAIFIGGFITAIVISSYYFTGQMIADGFELIADSTTSDEVKEGVIQVLAGVLQNMVALTAVGALGTWGAKLCEN